MEDPLRKNGGHEASQTAILPTELLAHVTPAKLIENAHRYPEMRWEPTERQQERLRMIHEVLKQIPLIHGTRYGSLASESSDLLPTDELPPEHRGNSLESDRSLGLTKCVFFGWGLAEKKYGKHVLCFSPDILDLNTTFVTPSDIGHIVLADEKPFLDFRPDERARVQTEYFDLMVRGRDWLEIIARRVLKMVENGERFVHLYTTYSLGEVKHTGIVPNRYILGSFSSQDLRPHYRFLYEHGFAFNNIEFNRRTNQQGVDPTPEECGVDYEHASQFWKRKLGIT